MTREQAYRIADDAVGPLGSFSNPPRTFVDMAVALGMLKLDEPKNTEDTARDIYHECAVGGMNSRYFIYQIYAAGLKIVKK